MSVISLLSPIKSICFYKRKLKISQINMILAQTQMNTAERNKDAILCLYPHISFLSLLLEHELMLIYLIIFNIMMIFQ